MKSVEWFISERGDSEPLEFIRGLHADGRRAVGWMLWRLQTEDKVPTDLAHQIRGDLWVLRARWAGIDYRLLYFVEGGQVIVVTAGFLKKTQKEPESEITKSVVRMWEWRRRRRAGERC